MNRLKSFAIIGLLMALMATGSICAYADEGSIKEIGSVESSSSIATPEILSAPDQGLLMTILDKVGLAKYLNQSGIKIYGYTEAGYMYDTTAPQPYAGPTYLAFDSLRNTPVVNKISLKAERTVDASKKQFDIGFCLQGIWGYDAKFIHSAGLGDTQTGRYQLDPLQAYVDVALPYIPVKIRVGKWLELGGFEQFDANLYGAFGDPMRAFYSYSYQCFYAEPGTQTGLLGTYVVNPHLTLDLGFSEGWNHSSRNPNGYLDIIGRITYAPTDKTTIIFAMTEGPEYPVAVGRGLPDADTKDWWTSMDLVITHKLTDKISLGTGVDFVNAPHIPGLENGSKQWGGITGYLSYAINQYATANGRLEWFNDSSYGFATGSGIGANYYETTLGAAIKPFPKDKILSNMLFRPEVRIDWADEAVFAKGDRSQVTLAGDVLFTF